MTNHQQYYDNNTTTINQNHHHHDNNYNIAHGPERVLTPADCDLIREAYVDNVGQMTAAVAKMIETAFDAGLTVEEIIMAIEETGLAPRPSPYYLRAILKNWAETGVTVSRLRHSIKANTAMKWWK